MLNVLSLFGCIAFSIDVVSPEQETGEPTIVDTSDTQDVETGIPDDSGEIPDTSDTEETDTQETDTPDDGDEYTSDEMMMGNYIELKNDLLLVNELEDGHSLFETRNFLRFDEDWGFAVTLMPYDEETADMLAGPNNTDGQEISLFVSGNNIITLQFEHYNEGMYRPVVRLVSKGVGNETIGFVLVEQPYYPDGTGPSIEDVPMYSREEIVSGLRIAALYTESGPMHEFTLYINNPGQPAIETMFGAPSQSNLQASANLADVRFGLGVAYDEPTEPPALIIEHDAQDVKAKVDNLLIYVLTTNGCSPDIGDYLEPPEPTSEDPDPTVAFVEDMDCLPGLPHVDGFHLWSMDPVLSDLAPDTLDENLIEDTSQKEMNPPNVHFNFVVHQGEFINHSAVPNDELFPYFKFRSVEE